MALTDEVSARYSAQRLIQLTNPGSPSSTTLNASVLSDAATDVQADFEIEAGVAYDNTDARHVSVAVEGVVAKLLLRVESPGEGARTAHDRYIERLGRLAKVTGRNRLLPQTTAITSPTDRTSGASPDFDDSYFDDLKVAPPD